MTNRGRHRADESLALALAKGQTLADAARAAGVSERTARRRWADPDFRRRVADLRGEVLAPRHLSTLLAVTAGCFTSS